MDLAQLAHRLHHLNQMEQAGQDAQFESIRLDEEITIYHIRTYWSTDGKEWIICDTRIHDREE